MAIKIEKTTRVQAAGTKVKIIEEYMGRVNTETSDVSIAHMKSPKGWEEPGLKPEFIAVCTPAFSMETVHRD